MQNGDKPEAGAPGSGWIQLRWGDGLHSFCLRIGEWRKIEGSRDVGPQELYRRFERGTWRIDDVRETLRWGLIGGGMTPNEASRLLELYFDGRPAAESLTEAMLIAGAGLIGPTDDTLGKPKAAKESTSDQTESSLSPRSTARVVQ